MKRLFQLRSIRVGLTLLIIAGCCYFIQKTRQHKTIIFEQTSIGKAQEFYSLLSKEEREALELFFYHGFIDSYAYVLFGDKPISICFFPKVAIWDIKGKIASLSAIIRSFLIAHHPAQRKIQKGWITWQKYQHLFQLPNFIIKKEAHFLFKDGADFILIINKKNFLKAVSCHLKDFQKVLGSSVTPENLYQRCLRGENLLRDVLKSHEGLIGILFGYGRNNAWKYYTRNQLRKELKNNHLSEDVIKNKKQKIAQLNRQLDFFPNDDFAYLKKAKTLSDLRQGYVYLYKGNFPNSLGLPAFACDHNDPETEYLQQVYKNNKKAIQDHYRNKNFLVTTLEKLFSPE